MPKEYPKINTIWMREEGKKKGCIIEGQYARPEFPAIKYWHVTEKINGTNMRIVYTSGIYDDIKYLGKTDNAELYSGVKELMDNTFPLEKMKKQFGTYFDKDVNEPINVMFYGEAYGGKVNSEGKKYSDDERFILFDVNIDGFWLTPDKVKILADELGVEYVPVISEKMTEEEILEMVKRGLESRLPIKDKSMLAEGVVCRSVPQMFFRSTTDPNNTEPIIWKIKGKDYERLKRIQEEC